MQYIKCFKYNTSIIYLSKNKQGFKLMIDEVVINKIFSSENKAIIWMKDNLEIYDNF